MLAAAPVLAADPGLAPVAAPSNFILGRALPAMPPAVADVPAQLPSQPPAPPPVAWEVWGFFWNGTRRVKQPTHCLKTTNLQQAVDYATEVFSFAGWQEKHNIPHGCMPDLSLDDPYTPSDGPTDGPPPAIYTVWTYKLTDGKWVKQEDHCFMSIYGAEALAYYRELARHRQDGWYVTTNMPSSTFLRFEKTAAYYNADGTLKDPSNPPPE